ncbi:MAG: hypothetical protein ACXVCP_03600 [Bdellovibrio sp.]
MNYILFALLLFVQVTHARGLQAKTIIEKKQKAILSFVPGSIEKMRVPIINELVAGDMSKLDAPPFPRFWTEFSDINTMTSTTKVGAKIPVVDFGGKLNLEFKYSLKTGFVIVSSAEKNKLKKYSGKSVSYNANSAGILSLDETTFLNYANASKGNPMVGLCVYEASLNIEKTVEGGFNFIVEESVKKGNTTTMTNAVFSNFFQIRNDVPVSTYIKEICGGIFKNEIESVVVNDFSKMVIEKLVAFNQKSNCTESRASDNENGDPSCQQWHSSFPQNVQNLTVPRCMLQKNGSHRCRLKAREGTACHLYINPETRQYSDSFSEYENSVLATENNYAYGCDKKAGLNCVLEKEPILLSGVPLFPGRARCQATQE